MNWYEKTDKKLQDAISKIEEYIDGCSKFKIGKTGQEPKERFESEDYRGNYGRIEEVHSSNEKDVIDNLVKALIKHFRADKEYSKRCDNVAVGGSDMDASEKYYVYVVIKQ